MSLPVVTRSRGVRVFVSYSTKDTDLAESVVVGLEEHPGIACFLAPRNIPEGEYWASELESAIRTSDVVLLLYTAASADSQYVQQEIRWAEKERTPIWMLKEPDLRLNEFFNQFGFTKRQAYSLRESQDGPFLDSLVESLGTLQRKLNLSAGTIDAVTNPYPGFGPFNESSTRFYFGREEDCESLANALYDGPCSDDFVPADAGQNTFSNLLLVYGPSGVGKSSLLRVGLPGRIVGSDWLSKPILFSHYKTGENRATFLMRAAFNQLHAGEGLQPAADLTSDDLAASIATTIRKGAAQSPRLYIFCFDQMEELFEQKKNKEEINDFLRDVLHLLQVPQVRVLVSFREEALGSLEPRVRGLGIPWRLWRISELSTEKAKECIVGPARACGVDFSEPLADELVKVLERPEGRDLNYQMRYSVEPVSLQLVCRNLWQRVANSPARINMRIHESSLPDIGNDLHERVKNFVDDVVTEYLDKVIDEVAEEKYQAGSRTTTKEQWLEFIRTSLVLFVGQRQGQRRQRVAEVQLPNCEKRVGRFSEELINIMINKGLVHRCDDAPEYELVHDVLAEAIDRKYRGSVLLVPKLNILESSLRDVTQMAVTSEDAGTSKKDPLRGFFNANATLLNDLENARHNLYFYADEAAFLLRCSLGQHDQKTERYKISSLGWALDLGRNAPETLAGIIADGLAVNPSEDEETGKRNNPVRRDVIKLLRSPEIRKCLVDQKTLVDHMKALVAPLRRAALGGTPEVRELACAALLEIEDPQGVEDLFVDFRERREADARSAMVFLRHSADVASGNCKVYWDRWRQLALWTRVGIARSMCAFRVRQSIPRIMIMLTVAAIATAVGAAIPFMFVGNFGASLTLEDSQFGVLKGLFHGVFGGVVWGVTVPAALLLYGVVWRAGRINMRREAGIPVFLWAATGGALGGVANSLMIASVYGPDGIRDAGWIDTRQLSGYGDMLGQIFCHTRCGLVLPIFGLMVGVGIAWSLASIQGDPSEAWAGSLQAISTMRDAVKMLQTILTSVLTNAWRNAITVAIAGFLIFIIVRPGDGVCDPAATKHDTRCVKERPYLATLPYRAAGLVPVIVGGGLALEIAFLASIVVVRIGVSVEENRDFLRVTPTTARAGT